MLPGYNPLIPSLKGSCSPTYYPPLTAYYLLLTPYQVRFDKAFMFAYSMREKTHAHRQLLDDVPEPTKQRRLAEVIAAFNKGARAANEAEVGSEQLVLTLTLTLTLTPTPTLALTPALNA